MKVELKLWKLGKERKREEHVVVCFVVCVDIMSHSMGEQLVDRDWAWYELKRETFSNLFSKFDVIVVLVLHPIITWQRLKHIYIDNYLKTNI